MCFASCWASGIKTSGIESSPKMRLSDILWHTSRITMILARSLPPTLVVERNGIS